MEKIRCRALLETAVIRDDLQSTITMAKKINQDNKRPMEYLNKVVEIIRTGIINIPILEHWS